MTRQAGQTGGRRGMLPISAVRRAVVLAVIWAILTGAEADALVLGLAVVPLATWLSLRLLPQGTALRPLRILALLPRFIRASIVGGVDVARRAFDPRMPINPGWVALPVALPDGGKVALGAELSLMPGTLVAGSDGPRLLIHLLDRDQDIESVVRIEAEQLASAIAMPDADDGGRG
jgi:multicomponent Na+:H+ antiporter subunit E